MLTRVILAAGAAALAIATPAYSGPHGGGGGGNPHGDGGGPHGGGGGGGGNPHNGGGGGGPPAFAGGGGGDHGRGGGGPAPVFMGGGGRGHGGGGGGGFVPIFAGGGGGGHGHGHGGGGFAAPRQQAPAFAYRGDGGGRGHGGGQNFAVNRGGQGHGHAGGQQFAVNRGGHAEAQGRRMVAQQGQEIRGNGRQARAIERQQVQNSFAQQARGFNQGQQQYAANNPAIAQRISSFRNADTSFVGKGTRGLIDGCPPGLWMKNNGCMPPGQAAKLVGQTFAAASAAYPLSVLPQQLSYLYPDTPDYYYRYGDGYLYQVDRGTNLIDALLPLIGGGYVPGQYLPQSYMASYVPDYYGMNSFYPDYGGTCNRYADGVIYEVDCATGYVQDVIPMYAGGYGVGQMLPSAYSYYNVPMQYRTLYYDTPDYGYWYAPGAIYQYDQRSSLITSVAALMAPGFTVGQPLPVGYDAYNVPYDYRATYYDTPNAWYRYNNGYIYQVDPVTQIVTAIVASLLT